LDVAETFQASGCTLSLIPLDANTSEGRLTFELQADTLNAEKANEFAMNWIQRYLIESCLIVSGMNLKPEFENPKVLNESELSSVPRTYTSSFRLSGIIVASLQAADVNKFIELTRKLEMNANEQSLRRSLRWFMKAEDVDDPVDAFVSQWIAFNALYGMFDSNKRGDRTAIKNLINSHPGQEEIREILSACSGTVKKLASRNLTEWRDPKKNYSNELRQIINNHDVRRILTAVGLCLFVVRNQIFHGGTMPEEQIDFIRECSRLLHRIYRECFMSCVSARIS
jgi:hypothetical protein